MTGDPLKEGVVRTPRTDVIQDAAINENKVLPDGARLSDDRMNQLLQVAYDHARDLERELAAATSRLSDGNRKLELAKLALRKIGEFNQYEPAGPAAATARSTLSVLEAQ